MLKGNRFAALRELREQRQVKETKERQAKKKTVKASKMSKQTGSDTRFARANQLVTSPVATQDKPKKKGPGRPPGRRSNPDYTQISAYVPLDLLLSVQEELAKEQRQRKQRTARPVSDLVEELLQNWLKKQHRETSKT